MRLLQAIKGKGHGGAEGFFARLALGLTPYADQKLLLPPSKMPLETSLKELVQPMAFGGPLDLNSRIQFFKAISEWKPQIVLTWMNRATHFCPGPWLRKFLPPFFHVARLGGFYNLKYYRTCDALIGNTQGVVTYLINQGWPQDRVFYIPNFVASPSPVPPLSRKNFHIPEDACLLVAAGRLHRNKAFDTLIRALTLVPNTYLWLLGEGPEKASLEALTQELGLGSRVHFLGWQETPSPFYRSADIFVCPSRHEPLGNVLLDAWAHGCPLIAAASQGPKEFIQEGHTGLLFPIDDVASLAQSINTLWANGALRHDMTQKGAKFLQNTFSKEAVISGYLEVFNHIQTLPPRSKFFSQRRGLSE